MGRSKLRSASNLNRRNAFSNAMSPVFSASRKLSSASDKASVDRPSSNNPTSDSVAFNRYQTWHIRSRFTTPSKQFFRARAMPFSGVYTRTCVA